MDAATVETTLRIILSIMAGVAVISWVGYFLLVNHRSRKTNNAPVETARATVHWKDPEPEQQLLGRHSSWIYYIIFHTDQGDILRLYLNRDPYFSLQEGDRGVLTWQADRFWRFEKEE